MDIHRIINVKVKYGRQFYLTVLWGRRAGFNLKYSLLQAFDLLPLKWPRRNFDRRPIESRKAVVDEVKVMIDHTKRRKTRICSCCGHFFLDWKRQEN